MHQWTEQDLECLTESGCWVNLTVKLIVVSLRPQLCRMRKTVSQWYGEEMTWGVVQ